MKVELSLATACALPELLSCSCGEHVYELLSGLPPSAAASILSDWSHVTLDDDLFIQLQPAFKQSFTIVPLGQRTDRGRSVVLDLAEKYADPIACACRAHWPRPALEWLTESETHNVYLDFDAPFRAVVVLKEGVPQDDYDDELAALNDALSHCAISVRTISTHILVWSHESGWVHELPISCEGVVDRLWDEDGEAEPAERFRVDSRLAMQLRE